MGKTQDSRAKTAPAKLKLNSYCNLFRIMRLVRADFWLPAATVTSGRKAVAGLVAAKLNV